MDNDLAVILKDNIYLEYYLGYISLNIGEKIKKIRKYYKISQRELSRKAQISQAALSYIEAGREPSYSTLCNIAEGLNIDIGDLICAPIQKLFGRVNLLDDAYLDETVDVEEEWALLMQDLMKSGLSPEEIKEIVLVVSKISPRSKGPLE